jgi:hypothetical protein
LLGGSPSGIVDHEACGAVETLPFRRWHPIPQETDRESSHQVAGVDGQPIREGRSGHTNRIACAPSPDLHEVIIEPSNEVVTLDAWLGQPYMFGDSLILERDLHRR